MGISSYDTEASNLFRETRCWIQDRGPVLAKVVRTTLAHLGLSKVPLYLMGVSSGAAILMVLPREMPEVRGVYSQVKAIAPEKLELPRGRKYPPIVFVHMATMDPDNAKMVTKNLKVLKAGGTPAAQVLIEQQPITVEFLTSRSEGAIDVPMAKQIINLIEEKGYFNADKTLKRNMRPVTEQWAPEMQLIVGNLSLVRDKSNPGELFNVSWARHEFVHDHVDAVLEWLQNGGKGGQAQMDKLLEADRQKDAAAAAAWAKALRDGGWL